MVASTSYFVCLNLILCTRFDVSISSMPLDVSVLCTVYIKIEMSCRQTNTLYKEGGEQEHSIKKIDR